MKNIAVIGAGKGIGFHLVEYLLQSGNKVFALSRNIENLNQLKQNKKVELYNFAFDLVEKQNYSQIISEMHKQNFSPDVIYLNAAYLKNIDFQLSSESELLYTFQINFFSYFSLIQYFIKSFNKNIHFVAISSMGGVQGSVKFSGLSMYSASKAALNNLFESLSVEYQNSAYVFNVLALGAVNTEMLREAFPGVKAPINPQEIVEFIAWFGANGQKFFNGKILPVSQSTP